MNDEKPRLLWTDFVHELSRLLRANDIDDPIYLVGGAVRDAYLGLPIKDFDIAVNGDAIVLARRVADWLGADTFVLDRERDVARVLVNRQGKRITVDFARFRGATLENDLRDRDFTVNAIAVDLIGDLSSLSDPMGGASDLRSRILRRCSAAAISNDPIRALRAVRLSTQFGLKIHPDTAADLRAQADALTHCSGERLRDEFFNLLGLDQAARGLRVLQHLGLLQQLVSQSAVSVGDAKSHASGETDWARTFARVERTVAILKAISSRRTDNTAAAFDLGMLAIQLDRFRGALQAHFGREYGGARRHSDLVVLATLLLGRAQVDPVDFKLSAEEERYLRLAVSFSQLITVKECRSVLEQHRFWRRLDESGIDVIVLVAAGYLANHGNDLRQREWLDLVEIFTELLDVYFNRYDEIVDPPLLLNGHDIQDQLRVKPGPLVGKLLTSLREAQVVGEVRTKEEAQQFVAAKMATQLT